jgi:H+/Cl- antiporter ClcA
MWGSTALASWLQRLQTPAETVLLGLAALVGLATGLAVISFRYLIGFFQDLIREDLMESLFSWGAWTVALLPALGGLLVSLLLWYHPVGSTGLSGILRSRQHSGEKISITQIPIKILAAAISLGSGASLGPEGPSVELGGIIGLLLGRNLNFSKERIGLLVGAGAAAGLAAGFNAPIAGVFLALELVLAGSFTTSTVSVVVLAAVVSALVTQVGLGAQPAFMLPAYTQPAFVLPAYELRSVLELPFYLGLGLLASGVSITFGYSLQWGRSLFRGEIAGLRFFAKLPPLVKPVLGGLCVGLLGLWLPLGLGVGYETVESILQHVPFSLSMLICLLLGKLVMTGISLGSGFVGGTFAPALFSGAVLGSTYGQILNLWLPSTLQIASPPAYAMVGMAAVLAGSVRAPLTAVLLLFEMTRDYHIVLPLMAAVGLSIWITDRFHSPLVYQSAKPTSDPATESGSAPSVAEIMIPPPLVLPATTSLLQATQRMLQERSYSALAVNEDQQLVGILTLQDVERAALTLSAAELATWSILQVCRTEVLITFPDESITVAAQRMVLRDLQQCPVVSREDPSRVIGLLQKDQILLSEKLMATRQALEANATVNANPQYQGSL